VFTMAEDGPIRQRNFYRRHFKPAVLEAGLPAGLHFHSLRHTCAAFMIADGRHMEEVKDHLGHSSIRVTSDRYGHLFPKARQAVADGLDLPPGGLRFSCDQNATKGACAAPPRIRGPGKGP